MTPALSTDRLRANGVVGAGGAGFPTYEKLVRPAEVVIMNAAECEPLIHKDKELLQHFAEEALGGLVAVGAHVGATRAVLAIKEKYEELIGRLEPLAASRGVQVHRLPDSYPAGDEFVTVFEVTGRVIPPGGLPLDVGCLVQNVETLINVVRDVPVTHKYLTVAGEVPEPVTVRVPIGLSFGDLLRALDVNPGALGNVLIGGVMMGKAVMSFDEVVTRTTGALICFPPGHSVPGRYLASERTKARIGSSACDQCRFCTEMCPRYLLGHPVEPHIAMRRLGFQRMTETAILGSQFCCECNLCSLYSCPEDLFPMDACRDDKKAIREKELAPHPLTGREVRPHSMQAYRRIPVSSLIKKLGLSGFRNTGPLVEVDWQPREVRIPLRQHIGAPAVATVAVGDAVEVGQEIGAAPEGALGVAVHASVAGRVAAVGEEVVIQT